MKMTMVNRLGNAHEINDKEVFKLIRQACNKAYNHDYKTDSTGDVVIRTYYDDMGHHHATLITDYREEA